MVGVPSGPVVGFDLDMTLVDSAAGIVATMQAALAEVGRTATREMIWPHIGVMLETALAHLAPGADVAALVGRYRELYPEVGIPPITVLPGAAEAVRSVHDAGGRVLVVSAKVETAVRRVLAHAGLAEPPLGPDVVAGGLFGTAKASVLRDHAADVYVGDHPGDVDAARAADAVAVAVATGPFGADALRETGADVVLSDLRGFPAWLAERFPPGARRSA